MPTRSLLRFPTEVEATDLADQLNDAGISASVQANVHALNANIVGQAEQDFHVMIAHADFGRAHVFLDRQAKEDAAATEEHPFFSFTDDELLDVIALPADWTRFDVRLAQRLLGERGIPVDDAVLERNRAEQIDELRAPEPSSWPFVSIGIIAVVCGGLLAIPIGWHMSNARKTLPDGDQVFMFSAGDRRMGMWIAIAGTVMLVVWSLIVLRDVLFT